ncbi:M43 family zinc metalloprotease [Phaeocystidibacter luteus]|uniref:T9SS type A sorting domain-containing protein n=1 Tax=Phaeocystidibacter luteus TaxID=911197 RepID=A0A6N6RDB8_9FLAO|nr:M43 family zinc metalloprotease [Phaeocystidibacter luteus]KAB2807081.1 T9SS type A sorting domain-containing protein [Phaeocystidibacter luteus]
MRYLAILALALTTLSSAAQHQHSHDQCGTDIYYQQQAANNPQLQIERQEADELWMENRDTYTTGQEVVQTIPVVVHVMYYNFEDSISVAQVEDAIDVLNEDYSLTNSDAGNVRAIFASRQANLEIQFALAKKDPNGNATNGITYHQSDRSLGANDAIKGEINWPNQNYLNVWVVRAIDLGLPPSQGTILGYAAFPYNNQPVTDDGIVIRHDQMGRIGTAVSNGRTLTHEVGHFLNLYHPFQNGCGGQGDVIADTPPIASPSYGCNFNRNTCNTGANDEPDMIENYMDYANDVCVNTFTAGQKVRAKDCLNATAHPLWRRGMLTTTANHALTGIGGGTVNAIPTVKFTSERHTVCAGEDIQFFNLGASHDNGTTFSWEFKKNGQVISTSSLENPVMNFTQTGTYDVKFTITNGLGSDSQEKQAEFTVYDTNPYWDNNFTATFENDLPNSTWLVLDNGDGRKWSTSSVAAFGGTKSAINPNRSSLADGGDDILQSSAILLDETPTATLRFQYAWARQESSNQDRLTVLVSQDCGETWNIARLISSFQLNTAGANVTGNFVPNSSQWTEAVINLNSYVGPDPILIRFAYTPDGGNNLYIDEVRMDVGIGLEEELGSSLAIYPNPANTTLNINTGTTEDASYQIMNTNGQVVLNGDIALGQTEVSVENIPAGVYMVRVTSNGSVQTEKVVIQ